MTSILACLWNWYIDYLWNYDSNSWVATIAYAFRIWAMIAILPTLVLGLLVGSPFAPPLDKRRSIALFLSQYRM
jgi:hypothetical protein